MIDILIERPDGKASIRMTPVYDGMETRLARAETFRLAAEVQTAVVDWEANQDTPMEIRFRGVIDADMNLIETGCVVIEAVDDDDLIHASLIADFVRDTTALIGGIVYDEKSGTYSG